MHTHTHRATPDHFPSRPVSLLAPEVERREGRRGRLTHVGLSDVLHADDPHCQQVAWRQPLLWMERTWDSLFMQWWQVALVERAGQPGTGSHCPDSSNLSPRTICSLENASGPQGVQGSGGEGPCPWSSLSQHTPEEGQFHASSIFVFPIWILELEALFLSILPRLRRVFFFFNWRIITNL